MHAAYFTLGSLKINVGKVITTKITIHRNLDPQPHRKITIPAHPISTCCKKNPPPFSETPSFSKVVFRLIKYFHLVKTRGCC